ncbi:hypothetical protein BDQ17DRAFT_1332473 [Cyathus striatus]|nr:hypothetical protein BDQ17DRAFT_1332473 [Cyathus striatus]
MLDTFLISNRDENVEKGLIMTVLRPEQPNKVNNSRAPYIDRYAQTCDFVELVWENIATLRINVTKRKTPESIGGEVAFPGLGGGKEVGSFCKRWFERFGVGSGRRSVLLLWFPFGMRGMGKKRGPGETRGVQVVIEATAPTINGIRYKILLTQIVSRLKTIESSPNFMSQRYGGFVTFAHASASRTAPEQLLDSIALLAYDMSTAFADALTLAPLLLTERDVYQPAAIYAIHAYGPHLYDHAPRELEREASGEM